LPQPRPHLGYLGFQSGLLQFQALEGCIENIRVKWRVHSFFVNIKASHLTFFLMQSPNTQSILQDG